MFIVGISVRERARQSGRPPVFSAPPPLMFTDTFNLIHPLPSHLHNCKLAQLTGVVR